MKSWLNQKTPIGYLAQHSLFNFSRISKRIKVEEGFRSFVYKDNLGNPTIGYGHLINSNDFYSAKKRYSKTTLTEVFYNDLRRAISDFKKNYHYKTLPNTTQEIIIEMIFQLGIRKVLEFKKFNFYIKNKQFYLAAFEMMKSRWYLQTPKRANKLIIILLQYNDRPQRK